MASVWQLFRNYNEITTSYYYNIVVHNTKHGTQDNGCTKLGRDMFYNSPATMKSGTKSRDMVANKEEGDVGWIWNCLHLFDS